MAQSYIVGPMPGTPAWHARRLWIDGEGVFGASDAAAIVGISPYAQPLDVYRRVLGLDEVTETKSMHMGVLLEPVISTLYSEETGLELERPQPMLISQAVPYLAATPDAQREDGLWVELKSTTWRRAAQLGEAGSDWLPDEWLLQCQQQLYVTGADTCDVAVLVDRDTFRVYHVPRNDTIIEVILEAAERLRQRILARDPPPPDWAHPGTPELVRRLHGYDPNARITLPAETVQAWRKYQELGDRIRALEDERKLIRARVEYALGDASVGVVPDEGWELVRSQVHVREHVVKAHTQLRLYERRLRE